MFDRLALLASRLFGIIILPAQLPGDVTALAQDLLAAPWQTVRSWPASLVLQLLRQVFCHEKLTLPEDPMLERMSASRARYFKKGWSLMPLRTADGVSIDACIKRPANTRIAPRYVLFIGGNSQRYEDWLPYFDMYASDSQLGFLAFNFRGVNQSEGAITCLEDMLSDVRAAFDALVEERGVLPQHIVLHGFSIGGAIAAIFLAQPGAPRAVITSDRSFRSFSHAAFALVRGFSAAVGEKADQGEEVEEEQGARSGGRAALSWVWAWLFGLARALVAQLAVVFAGATGWELDAVEAWSRIDGKKVLVYNKSDNIISYTGSSLHNALVQADMGDPTKANAARGMLRGVAVIESTIQ
jgi:hypothetical protein